MSGDHSATATLEPVDQMNVNLWFEILRDLQTSLRSAESVAEVDVDVAEDHAA